MKPFALFVIDGQRYAVDADVVREFLRAAAIVKLPTSPPLIAGMLNIRGELVRVASLRTFIGLPEKDLEPSDSLIIVRLAGTELAILCDQLLGLASYADKNIELTKTETSSSQAIEAVIADAGQLIFIINLKQLGANVGAIECFSADNRVEELEYNHSK